jgi:urease accessory protein
MASMPSSTGFAAISCLSPDRPGRDGLLRLTFARRADKTILRQCRYKLPLQVLSPLTLDDGTCYLLLLNPTGGVLGGDHLRTEMHIEQGACVCLSTPSATRVHRTAAVRAEVETILCVASQATIEYLPDHLIPHPGSSLRQSLHIKLAQGARGIFLDNFAAGRAALNEYWQFRDLDSRMEVFLRSTPLYANRTKIAGPAASSPSFLAVVPNSHRGSRDLSSTTHSLPLARGRMSGYSYFGTLLIVADQFPDWRPVLSALRSEIESLPGIFGGASLLAHSGCCVRYLATSAIAFQGATHRLWTIARSEVLHLPPLDLRKY